MYVIKLTALQYVDKFKRIFKNSFTGEKFSAPKEIHGSTPFLKMIWIKLEVLA